MDVIDRVTQDAKTECMVYRCFCTSMYTQHKAILGQNMSTDKWRAPTVGALGDEVMKRNAKVLNEVC